MNIYNMNGQTVRLIWQAYTKALGENPARKVKDIVGDTIILKNGERYVVKLVKKK